MECAETLRLQAYFDGEADPAEVGAVEHHLQTCMQCQILLQELEQVRGLVREKLAPMTAPTRLRGRIMQALDEEQDTPVLAVRATSRPRGRPFWLGVLSGVGGTAIAAALGILVLSPLLDNPLRNEMVADHTRALKLRHLIDVVSTDQHTVKPWFAGRTTVSPVVADFASEGYRLLGGRIEALDGQLAAVVVYQHGAHFIDVFSWAVAGSAVPGNSTRNGYHLACWRDGDLGYCAVADTGWSELLALVGLLQDQGARETPQKQAP